MAEAANSPRAGLTRGALSKLTGCNIETIRYYENIGLMPDPPRDRGGRRVYGEDAFKRLTFIRRSRELGFSLDAVRGLLELVDGGDYTCAEVRSITLDHARDIRRRIADLRKIDRVLRTIAAQCASGDVPECPVIDALFEQPDEAGI
jgi:MerR family mercuric resistance operon transcriptional regulator